MIPVFWGIIIVKKFDSDFKLEVIREPQRNENVDLFYVSQLLWKDEAFKLLKKYGLEKGMKSKTRNQIWEKIAESLSYETISNYVRESLKNRANWRLTVPQLTKGDGLSLSASM